MLGIRTCQPMVRETPALNRPGRLEQIVFYRLVRDQLDHFALVHEKTGDLRVQRHVTDRRASMQSGRSSRPDATGQSGTERRRNMSEPPDPEQYITTDESETLEFKKAA